MNQKRVKHILIAILSADVAGYPFYPGGIHVNDPPSPMASVDRMADRLRYSKNTILTLIIRSTEKLQ